MYPHSFPIHPLEKFPVEKDFTPLLSSGETVSSDSIKIFDGETDVTQAMLAGHEIIDNRVKAQIYAAEQGKEYRIEIAATTSLGNTFVEVIMACPYVETGLAGRLRRKLMDTEIDVTKRAFSSIDLQEAITDASYEHGCEPGTVPSADEHLVLLLARADCLEILATDSARFFKFTAGKEGVDKSQVSKNYLETAKALREQYRQSVRRKKRSRTSTVRPYRG